MAAVLSAWQRDTGVRRKADGLRVVASSALLLLLLPSLPGAEPPGGPPVRDLQVTLYARRALAQDKALAPLNLFVHVARGVATVSGPVPSPAVADRVVVTIKGVRGVYEVRSDLRVIADDKDEALASLLAGLAAGPNSFGLSEGPSPPRPEDDGSGLAGAVRGRGEEGQPKQHFSAHLSLPARPAEPRELPGLAPRPAASLGPPSLSPTAEAGPPAPPARPAALARPVSHPPRADADLRGEAERLRTGDGHLWNIQIEVREGVVTLLGHTTRADRLMQFARAISEVPGVREVDITRVQTGSRP
jgi:hypothetical protein